MLFLVSKSRLGPIEVVRWRPLIWFVGRPSCPPSSTLNYAPTAVGRQGGGPLGALAAPLAAQQVSVFKTTKTTTTSTRFVIAGPDGPGGSQRGSESRTRQAKPQLLRPLEELPPAAESSEQRQAAPVAGFLPTLLERVSPLFVATRVCCDEEEVDFLSPAALICYYDEHDDDWSWRPKEEH